MMVMMMMMMMMMIYPYCFCYRLLYSLYSYIQLFSIKCDYSIQCVILSVRLSVMVDRDHVGWKYCKLIARSISPTPSLLVP